MTNKPKRKKLPTAPFKSNGVVEVHYSYFLAEPDEEFQRYSLRVKVDPNGKFMKELKAAMAKLAKEAFGDAKDIKYPISKLEDTGETVLTTRSKFKPLLTVYQAGGKIASSEMNSSFWRGAKVLIAGQLVAYGKPMGPGIAFQLHEVLSLSPSRDTQSRTTKFAVDEIPANEIPAEEAVDPDDEIPF